MCKLRLISGAEAFQAVHGPSPLTQICGFSPWRGMFTFVLIIILRTNLKSSEPVHSGILPDAMHLAHLAIFSDVYISLLLDLTDDYTKRDSKLSELFGELSCMVRIPRQPNHIRNKFWRTGTRIKPYTPSIPGISDRARRRLFTSRTIRPNAKEYRSISQKLLSAAASRYLIFWFSHYLSGLLASSPDSTFLQLPDSIIMCAVVCVVVHERELERERES